MNTAGILVNGLFALSMAACASSGQDDPRPGAPVTRLAGVPIYGVWATIARVEIARNQLRSEGPERIKSACSTPSLDECVAMVRYAAELNGVNDIIGVPRGDKITVAFNIFRMAKIPYTVVVDIMPDGTASLVDIDTGAF